MTLVGAFFGSDHLATLKESRDDTVKEPPASTKADLALGRRLVEQARCAACHQRDGAGNGEDGQRQDADELQRKSTAGCEF